MIPAISSAVMSRLSRVATMRPWRMTEMRSDTARTSRSLCVMKMIERPLAASARMVAKSSRVSCGVKTAVGSSRMSTPASR